MHRACRILGNARRHMNKAVNLTVDETLLAEA